MIDTCDDLIRLLTPLFVVFLSGLCSLSFQAMKPVLRYILWKRRFLLFIIHVYIVSTGTRVWAENRLYM